MVGAIRARTTMIAMDSSLAPRYLDALLAGDRTRALRVLDDYGLHKGVPAEALLLDVVMRAQADVGTLWQENRITVADEHVATAISQVALAHLYRHAARRPPVGCSAVVACVEGELHDMGARACADLLDLHGVDVTFAGANVPAHSLVALCQRLRPHVVALSVTMPFHLAALRSTVLHLRDRLGPSLKIAAGGYALQDASRVADLGLHAVGRNASTLVARLGAAVAN
jgi:methanogenic corrinoid protein MtbC1